MTLTTILEVPAVRTQDWAQFPSARAQTHQVQVLDDHARGN